MHYHFDHLWVINCIWFCIVDNFTKFEELFLVLHEPAYISYPDSYGLLDKVWPSIFISHPKINIIWLNQEPAKSQSNWLFFWQWPFNCFNSFGTLCFYQRTRIEYICGDWTWLFDKIFEIFRLFDYIENREVRTQ